MAKQVAKIEANGKKFTIVHRDGKGMPYVVYQHKRELRKCGYGMSDHKQVYAYCEDLYTALRDLALEF